MNLKQFMNPPGRGFALFFLKFILFSIVTWFIWLGIRYPYNLLLNSTAIGISKSSMPYIDSKFTQERGTFEVMFKPDATVPFILQKQEPVALKIFFNTLHFNFIPFMALLLASPLRNAKRFLIFVLLGMIFLFSTHIVHVYLDLKAYYFRMQSDKGYFKTGQLQLTPEQLETFNCWMRRSQTMSSLQGFMEQAGSMIVPAFVWMIYSGAWLFGAFIKEPKPPISQPR